MGNALVVVPEQDLTSGNLYVQLEGGERPVAALHPDDKAFARLDTHVVLRQHPDAYFRLRVKPVDIWQPPAEDARKGLDGFLGARFPGLYPGTKVPDSHRLTTWGWVAAIGSALNAVALLFYPLADTATLASLHSFGVQPTPLARLVANRWFSPLIAALTGACLYQAYRSPTHRRLWISVSYVPALLAFAVALIVGFSAVSSALDAIK